MSKNTIAAAVSFCFSVISSTANAQEAPLIESFRSNFIGRQIDEAQARNTRAIASQSYLWGLPAFLHFRQTTEIKSARKLIAPDEEPFGGWVLLRALATPQDTNNVLPNVDTLYGASYLLLDQQGPVVLSLPRVQDRYYSVALHDAYFNAFAVLGTRATNGDRATVLILPPQYDKAINGDFTQIIQAPTNGIALFQRIYTRDASDVDVVRALQDAITLTPLSNWPAHLGRFPKIQTPEFDVDRPVRLMREISGFFEIVSGHTCRNSPPESYAALVATFRQLNIGPCDKKPSTSELPSIEAGARDAQALLSARISSPTMRNGWQVPDPNTGKVSLDYTGRAVIQLTQIGSFPPEEAIYFVGRKDAFGDKLSGGEAYTLHFERGHLPPIDPRGFWSLTMYDATTNLLVENPLQRYIIRPTTAGLKVNSDESLSIYISHERRPDMPEGNWLPAPKGEFIVVLRTYLPSSVIQNGEWFPPVLRKR